MGFMAESEILRQSKKAQGETNQRLDALLAEVQRTNQLLAQLVQVLAGQQPPQQRTVTWGTQQG